MNLAIIEQNVERIVLVENREMRRQRAGCGARPESPPNSAAPPLSPRFWPATTGRRPTSGSARSFAEPALTASVKGAFDERRTLPDDDQPSQEVAQHRYQRLVRWRHRIIAEPGGAHPGEPLPFASCRHSRPLATHVERHQQVKIGVRV